jgi:hypothetical protein
MSNMLYILGASLAQTTGKEEGICRGMLCLSVMDSVKHLQQTSDITQVLAHMQTMTYQDWKAIIEGTALLQRVASIGITRPVDVIARLKQTLVEKQSLLTMAAH